MSTPRSWPNGARLTELIRAMRGQRVVMLVDLVADRFIIGRPKRISREAPVLILQFESERLVPGGGANAVANVRALGGIPLPVGLVGEDPSGDALLTELRGRGVGTDGVLCRSHYQTPTKTRILGGGGGSIEQQIVRIDSSSDGELAAEDSLALRERLGVLAKGARVAVMSDYGYGAVEPGMLPALRQAMPPDSLVIGDSRYRLREFRGLDGATPNQEEAEAWWGAPLATREAILTGGRKMLEESGGHFLLITRGNRGMALVVREEGGSRISFIPVSGTDQVADVTGAGDTVIGTLALGLAAGASPAEAALLATLAAGVVVMKRGTSTVSSEELLQTVDGAEKLLDAAEWDASSA